MRRLWRVRKPRKSRRRQRRNASGWELGVSFGEGKYCWAVNGRNTDFEKITKLNILEWFLAMRRWD